ncbi:MAG: LON peptidase substrate-binding domain-containing protein, partial [Bacteroidota bacterium]
MEKLKINKLFLDDQEGKTEFIPLITDDDDDSIQNIEIPEILPVLPLKNTVLFPGVILPIVIGREKSVQLINHINEGNKLFGAVAQKDPNKEEPDFDEMYKIGTLGQIVKILEMPDGSNSVVIQGRRRIRLKSLETKEPFYKARVEGLPFVPPAKESEEFNAIISSLKDLSIKIINLSENIPNEVSFAIKNIGNIKFLMNFISSNSDIKVEDKQFLLEQEDIEQRGKKLLEYLTQQVQKLELKNDIQSKVKKDIDKQQRDYMLQQQMKHIQQELGGNPVEQEIKELQQQAKKKKWSKEVKAKFDKEIKKLQRTNPSAPDHSVQLNYLQTLLELPWEET